MTTIADVKRAAGTLDRRRAAVEEAEAVLQRRVRDALAAGERAVDIAEALGVSRARVYQLRDGTR